MQAGRALDAVVAEKVMGWDRLHTEKDHGLVGREPDDLRMICHVPHYSTDIAAAWQVVEQMRGMIVTKRQAFIYGLTEVISDRMFPNDAHHRRIDMSQTMLHVQPIDICLAALKAVGVEVDHVVS